MTEIHAPYHFVPMSKWVYMPENAHLVSHDVPFSDGMSGVIEYVLTNHTPLCVGSEKDPNTGMLRFTRDPSGNPIIPGSSLKGMIRQVLSIASFGKFSQLDDQTFSFRDISSSKNNYLVNYIKPNTVQAGWLKYNHEYQRWQFTPCQHCKIKHKTINAHLNTRIINASSAVAKYQQCPLNTDLKAVISEPKGEQGNRWAEDFEKGDTEGKLVFTNTRILGKGKKDDYEFSYFFFDHDQKRIKTDIQEQVANLFANHGEEQVNYLKKNGDNDLGMPVFALVKGEKVHSLGFAKMPRVSYRYGTSDLVNAVNRAHQDDLMFDLPEVMFGTLRDKGLGLKSRVIFTDATGGNLHSRDLYPSEPLILSSPKPTFYPAYIEQKRQTGYADYDTKQAPSGTKRYISIKPKDTLESNVGSIKNENVISTLELCKPQSEFKGKIIFHNLTPIELGALLWSLQMEKGICHQLGHGKPMGAGAVTLFVQLSKCQANDPKIQASQQVPDYVQMFTDHMETQHPNRAWRTSPQIEYLLALGDIHNNKSLTTSYMELGEFQTVKTNHIKMQPFYNDVKKAIPRHESFSTEGTGNLAFGAGRLAHLLPESGDVWVDEQHRARKKKLDTITFELAQQAEQEKAAAKKASLTEHQFKLDELTQTLASTTDVKEHPPLIRLVVAFFKENVVKKEAETCLSLYHLAKKYGYHKRPTKKAKAQKQELNDLLALYEITLTE